MSAKSFKDFSDPSKIRVSDFEGEYANVTYEPGEQIEFTTPIALTEWGFSDFENKGVSFAMSISLDRGKKSLRDLDDMLMAYDDFLLQWAFDHRDLIWNKKKKNEEKKPATIDELRKQNFTPIRRVKGNGLAVLAGKIRPKKDEKEEIVPGVFNTKCFLIHGANASGDLAMDQAMNVKDVGGHSLVSLCLSISSIYFVQGKIGFLCNLRQVNVVKLGQGRQVNVRANLYEDDDYGVIKQEEHEQENAAKREENPVDEPQQQPAPKKTKSKK